MAITQSIRLEYNTHLRVTPFPLADANGNCVTYSDDSGNIQAHYTYDAFGGTISSYGDMDDDFHFRFSSKYLDDETGFYYYGYRYYAPALGRWVNRDPIGERGGLLLYGFTENDGLNGVDKVGLFGEWFFRDSEKDDKSVCPKNRKNMRKWFKKYEEAKAGLWLRNYINVKLEVASLRGDPAAIAEVIFDNRIKDWVSKINSLAVNMPNSGAELIIEGVLDNVVSQMGLSIDLAGLDNLRSMLENDGDVCKAALSSFMEVKEICNDVDFVYNDILEGTGKFERACPCSSKKEPFKSGMAKWTERWKRNKEICDSNRKKKAEGVKRACK